MDAIEAILGRRSIRQFRPGTVSEELVMRLLAAGMSAPSAGNEQPWHFIIIGDREVLNSVTTVHPHSSMLRDAPLAIVVCGNLNLEKHRGFWVQDCSAATQNILVAAHASGLGAVWLGVHPREDRVNGVRKLLSIPEHVLPLCIIALGWPGEEKPPVDRFSMDRVHRDTW